MHKSKKDMNALNWNSSKKRKIMHRKKKTQKRALVARLTKARRPTNEVNLIGISSKYMHKKIMQWAT